LRRLQAAWAASSPGGWAFVVALAAPAMSLLGDTGDRRPLAAGHDLVAARLAPV
jgi:hypothetical protein